MSHGDVQTIGKKKKHKDDSDSEMNTDDLDNLGENNSDDSEDEIAKPCII